MQGASMLVGRPALSSGLPSTSRFVPHAVVYNTSDLSVTARARIRYTANGKVNVVAMGPVALAANETRELDLSRVVSAIGEQIPVDADIEIEPSGKGAAVIATVVSVDRTGSQVVEPRLKSQR